MVCVNHSRENGVNTCSICGEWLCESCSVDIDGRIFCKTCIAKKVSGRAADAVAVVESPKPRRYYSGFLLFLCSCVMPGVNYMYLGLIKRGLFFLSAFFSIVFAMSVTGMGELGILIPILWVTSFFDGFEKKRRLNSGAYVPDSVDDILSWLKKYRTPVIVAGVFFLVMGVTNSIGRYVYFAHRAVEYGNHYAARPLLGLVALFVGGYFLIKAAANRRDRRRDATDGGDRSDNG